MAGEPVLVHSLSIAAVQLVATGFVDIFGSKDLAGSQSFDFVAQPELRIDVLALFGRQADTLFLGAEWFVHRFPRWPIRSGPRRLGSRAPGPVDLCRSAAASARSPSLNPTGSQRGNQWASLPRSCKCALRATVLNSRANLG